MPTPTAVVIELSDDEVVRIVVEFRAAIHRTYVRFLTAYQLADKATSSCSATLLSR